MYEEFRKKAVIYFYRRTSNLAISEDMASDVIVKLLEAEKKGKGATNHWNGYAFRICHNMVVDLYRHRSRVRLVDKLESISCRMLGFGQIEDEEVIDRLLGSVTYRQLEVIHFRYLEGMSFEDIAKLTDNTLGGVKAILHRAIKRIRNTYKETYADEYTERVRFASRRMATTSARNRRVGKQSTAGDSGDCASTNGLRQEYDSTGALLQHEDDCPSQVQVVAGGELPERV